MRILFVTHRYWPYPGGSEQYVGEMAARFAADGHRVTVVTSDAWSIEHFFTRGGKTIDCLSERHRGVSIRRVRVRRLPFRATISRAVSRHASPFIQALLAPASPFLPTMPAVLSSIREMDIVHASAFPYDSLLAHAWRYANSRAIPFALTPFVHFGEPHETPHLASRLTPFQRFLLQRSNLVLVQTGLEKNALDPLKIRPENIAVLGVGVNPNECAGGDGGRFREKHGIGKDTFIILHVAEKSLLKGSIHLVEAVRKVRQAGMKATIVFGGASSMEDFRKYMERQDDETRRFCVFPGFIPDDEKRDMFAACDLYAMPSKTDTFGIVYLEAWLAGKPVIGAFAGGVPEVITDGQDGFLVPFGNVPMLAEYIVKLMRDPALRVKMGKIGRRKVYRLHTWEKKYERLKELFTRLTQ